MIKITKLDENLSLLRDKKVVIWSARNKGPEVLALLLHFNINVYAFCDNDASLWGSKVNEVKVMSPFELETLASEYDDIVVQIALENPMNETIIIKTLQYINISKYISYSELIAITNLLKIIKFKRNNQDFIVNTNLITSTNANVLSAKQSLLEKLITPPENLILICLPPKTADFTITQTLQKSGINCVNLWHRINSFNKDMFVKILGNVKIITAVREPIMQNLSDAYQQIGGITCLQHLKKVFFNSNVSAEDVKQYENMLLKNGGNAQECFDYHLKFRGVVPDCNGDIVNKHTYAIQNFVPYFQEKVVDFLAYPFDKEKGYSIVKEGNIEVFVYQLEKLNNLIPELSNWIGKDFTSLINGNGADDKWIAPSYKQAQNEIKITKKYFDESFSQPYVKHCYSEQDIQKFKDKWSKHIKD